MGDSLHSLLHQDDQSSLPRIEKALRSEDALSADQEAVLNALIWQRCTSGASGLLGCLLSQDCASRIEVLPDQLAHIGATDAASAMQELLHKIPLDTDQIHGGLVDWIDTQPGIVNVARELDEGLGDIDQVVWAFMKNPTSDIPDIDVPTRTEAIMNTLTGIFRPSGDDRG